MVILEVMVTEGRLILMVRTMVIILVIGQLCLMKLY